MDPLTLQLRTGQGRTLRLSAPIGRGGGGIVYADPDEPLAVKLLKERSITPQADELIRAMVDRRVPTAVPGTEAIVAWPTDVVLDQHDRVVGYVMPKAIGPQPHILNDLMHPLSRERIAVNLAWRTLVRLAQNTAATIAHLHDVGVVVGDINESNILAGGGGQVTLIDCDSMQFRDRRGRRFFSPYHKPEYLAPELDGIDLHHVARRREHDRYAMAVLFFQLLMDNWHPFSGVGGPENARLHDHARAGRFPYPGDLPGFRPPPGAPPWRVLPGVLQQMFIHTFREGSRTPSERPTAAQWRDALKHASGQLRLCGGPRSHYFPRGLSACPWCERDIRLGRVPVRRR